MNIQLNTLIELFPNHTDGLVTKLIINEISIDSRETVDHALFIPIEGERFDGHQYLQSAIANGAVATLWNEAYTLPQEIPENFPVFFVSNTTQALHKLATHYREVVNPIVIGITGSNGKTTTKDILASILQTTYATHATAGNFNNAIGLPLTILSMPRQTKLLVVEMGMNDFGEIDELTKIAQPDYAIITNIGESHIEHLGSREGIAKAKLEIKNGLKKAGILLIDGDEFLLKATHQDENVIKCGFGNENDIIISNVQLTREGTFFTLNHNRQYMIPLLGKHHAQNASFAITIANQLNVSEEDIQRGLKLLSHSAMRFEFVNGKYDSTLINDAYNASPTSMKAAIDIVNQLDGFKKRIVVLGDILELGDFSKEFHLSVAKHIKPPVDIVFTYGEAASHISNYIEKNIPKIQSKHFESKEQLIRVLTKCLEEKVLILLKASRGMAFEEIVENLKDK